MSGTDVQPNRAAARDTAAGTQRAKRSQDSVKLGLRSRLPYLISSGDHRIPALLFLQFVGSKRFLSSWHLQKKAPFSFCFLLCWFFSLPSPTSFLPLSDFAATFLPCTGTAPSHLRSQPHLSLNSSSLLQLSPPFLSIIHRRSL